MLGTFMMTFAVGIASVLQGGLNKVIGSSWGLASAIWLNASVFWVAATIYLIWMRNIDQTSLARSGLAWWYLIPGLLGFSFVLGVPFAIERIGASSVFVILIASQVLGGLCWDMQVEGSPLTGQRIVGALLTLAGAAVISWPPQG